MEVFEGYSVSSKKKKTAIKAILVYHGLESAGALVGRGVFYALPLLIIYYIKVDYPWFWLMKLILMVCVVWALRPYVERIHYFFSPAIAIIDKEKNTLSSDTDKDVLTLSDIKEIKVVEDPMPNDEVVYRLRFHFSDGEKTSKFAFTTYKLASEVEEVIKKTISS